MLKGCQSSACPALNWLQRLRTVPNVVSRRHTITTYQKAFLVFDKVACVVNVLRNFVPSRATFQVEVICRKGGKYYSSSGNRNKEAKTTLNRKWLSTTLHRKDGYFNF